MQENTNIDTYDVLVIGAGLAGLTAASVLLTEGRSVMVVDKGSAVGGRLSTRAVGSGWADCGAQFFTVRDERFAQAVEPLENDGLVYVWSRGWSNGSLDAAPSDGHPRYAVRGGMQRLAEHMASPLVRQGLVATSTQIVGLAKEGAAEWIARTDDGRTFRTSAVIVTCPVPQALDLFAAGGTNLAQADLAVLQNIRYAPSLCGLFWVNGPVLLPEPGALQMPEAAVSWIADNQRKGISPEAVVLTVHGSPEWSQLHFDDDEETILDRLRAEVSPLLSPSSVILDAKLKRWKYALPLTVYPERLFALEGAERCLLGGDAFGAGRVEGAYLSGVALGEEMARVLEQAA